MSWGAWIPHLGRGAVPTVQHHGQQPRCPSGAQGGESTGFSLLARPATLAEVLHLQGCQERIQSTPTPNTGGQGPRQALGDKGPLLSLAGPGMGTGPTQ